MAPAASPGAAQLFSTELAGLFHLDGDTFHRRFQAEMDRCLEPMQGYDLVSCLLMEGLAHSVASERDLSLTKFREANALLKAKEDSFGAIYVSMAMAEAERRLGQREEASRIYRRILDQCSALRKSKEPITVESFSLFARVGGFPDHFLHQMKPLLPMMRGILVNLLETMVRDSFGVLLMIQDHFDGAEEQLNQALVLSRSIFGLVDGQILDHLGQLRERQRRFEEAGEFFEQAFIAAQRIGDLNQQYGALRRRAAVEMTAGLFSKSLDTLHLGLNIARTNGNPEQVGEFLRNMMDFHYRRGDPAEALQSGEEALKIGEATGNPWLTTLVQFDLAGLAMATGDYEEAIRRLEEITTRLTTMVRSQTGVSILRVNALLQLSEAYYLIGKPRQMADRATLAKEIALRINYSEGLAFARLLEEWSNFVKARERNPQVNPARMGQLGLEFQEALESSDLTTLRRFARIVGPVFKNLASHLSQDQTGASDHQSPTAIESDSYQIFGSNVAKMFAMARATNAGHYQQAKILAEDFLQDMRRVGNRDYEAFALGSLAAVHWKLSEKWLALDRAQEAIQVLETNMGDIHIDDLLQGYLGHHRSWIYQIVIQIFVQAGEGAQAFDVAEMARARTLLHQLGNQRFSNTLENGSPLHKKLEEIRQAIFTLEGGPSALEAVKKKRDEYDQLLVKAKLQNSEYMKLVKVEPSTLKDLQTEILGPKTTLVVYYIAVDDVLAWVVDRQGIHVVTLPVKRQQLRDVLCLSERISRPSKRGIRPKFGCTGRGELLEDYFNNLVAPLLPHIRHEELLIIPHGLLHYVPFAALRDLQTGKQLVDIKTISYAPSVSVLGFLEKKASPFEGRALILGDPETDLAKLPWAREEAVTVADLFDDTQALLGPDATEQQVHDAVGKVDLLHLAAHGVYRPWSPRFSHISLAKDEKFDGALEVNEVFQNLDLRGVNLVTLSACQTALGERSEGDEIIGLTRAFLYAGSPAVLSSLWRVNDRSTAFLMQSFYRSLLAGESYAQALRSAQLQTRQQPGWEDPYYWAAFTLAGDGEGNWDIPGGISEGTTVSPEAHTIY